jgi:hypothetical protein
MHHSDHCDRCNGPLELSIMSKFNRDIICTPCKDDECEAPGYAAADAAEVAAVRAGDYNFPGIGLSPQDQAFLAARRAARKSPTTVEG